MRWPWRCRCLTAMVIFCLFWLALLGGLGYCARKYSNPYKLVFIFGKKGAGKSCYMVHEMLKLQKRGWTIYTDMKDVYIPGVRIISVSDLILGAPEPRSAVFLDEVGISMDNRNYKNFPPGLRDFFKYLRKMKCRLYMNSQAYDVDKKVRDTVDSMVLQTSLFNCISISRPIVRAVTLTESTAQADSRIADDLRFTSVFSWRVYWMPSYFKYFNSLEMPPRPTLPYLLSACKKLPEGYWRRLLTSGFQKYKPPLDD